MKSALGKLQGEYRTDVLKFWNSAPAGIEKTAGKWDEIFTESDITYDVDINIDNFGSSGGKKIAAGLKNARLLSIDPLLFEYEAFFHPDSSRCQPLLSAHP
ncbi:Ger(x)C family spore germination C-terminal domain-containing protein [Bacillus paralicheniformis]|uniref:Ger(x)C family spore germination C-terminal domain-containing protein n=1 Tax=Bacillus paralicheniformis TaxID=1648923 RepID=UPI003B97EA4F